MQKANAVGASPYLSIRNLSKRFNAFVALHEINLDVEQGEFICFLGPSGCGKTTLLRTIAGLTPQTEGRISQAGRDISKASVTDRDFGIVFQSYALFPNLSVIRNVRYGLDSDKRLNVAQRIRRADELLDLVGLSDERDKYPAQLSGGQQQRVALARALANSPGLLLLDEPLSALDARVRLRLRTEIKALQSRIGVTTIMVTHDQEEALTMADRIVVMNKGKIEQIGTPREIYCQPATAFVADFIGAMNVLDAEVDSSGALAFKHLTIDCRARLDGLSPGSQVSVCLRPEDVVLLQQGESAGNAFDGRVASLEFLGSSYRCLIDISPDGYPSISMSVSMATAREANLDVGSGVRVALPADNLHVFQRDRSRLMTQAL